MGLWKDKERGDWRYSFQYLLKTYAGGGFATKGAARAGRETRRKEVQGASKQQQTQHGMAFRECASLYLDEAERRFATKTYKYKAYVYKSFLEYAGNIPIDEITPQIVGAYLNTRHSNHNLNVHRKDLSALFAYAKKRLKLIHINPCEDIDKMPHTPAEKRIPSEEEVLKLILAAGPNDRPLILTLLHTVARIDEILRLRWLDVNFEKRQVTRWTRKRKGGAYAPIGTYMNADLYDILKRLWDNREQDAIVFYNPVTKRRFKNRPKLMPSLCKKAGIDPPFGFHALRHFVASLLSDKEKVSTKTISGILGHLEVRTTEIYLHSIGDSMKDAMSRLEGKFMLADNACGSGSNEVQKTASGAIGNMENIE